MSEEMFVRQCAPTLAGGQDRRLFSCPYDTREGMTEDVRRLNRVLVPKGLEAAAAALFRKESACCTCTDRQSCGATSTTTRRLRFLTPQDIPAPTATAAL